MKNVVFKNCYINFFILFIVLILLRTNELFFGLGFWNFYVNTIFICSVYSLIFLFIGVNAIFFFKKHYMFGIFQILILSCLLLSILFINLVRPVKIRDYIKISSSYAIQVEYEYYNDYFYFTQKDRLLFFFAKKHCIDSYRIIDEVSKWEKVDNNKIKINGKIVTLTKGDFFKNNYECIHQNF